MAVFFKNISVRAALRTSLRLRFLVISLTISALISALLIVLLHLARANHATDKIALELRDLATLNAGLIYTAEQAGAWQQAQDILRVFSAFSYVYCVEYQDARGVRLASWPDRGCEKNQAKKTPSSLQLQLQLPQKRQLEIGVNTAIQRRALQQETMIFSGVILVILLVIFMVISRSFEAIVLQPIAALNRAMMASTPINPIPVKSSHADEIGTIVKTYNRVAASARRYVRRLHKSEAALRNSEARASDMAELSSDWYFEMDADMRFTMLSNRFFELVKRNRQDIIGHRRDEMSGYGLNTANWRRHLGDLHAHRAFRNFEYSILQDDGSPKHISISGNPQFDKGGKFLGYLGAGSDVTAIRQNEWRLAEANRNFGESVTYAAAIQRSLLPTKETLTKHLGRVSTLWQPKDLVGGDFYWCGAIADVDYVVFFDCTGHGVPGALMTLIATSAIERIALSSEAALPANKMIKHIHEGVCKALGVTSDRPGKDGLDCAVVRLDRCADKLEFCGASIDLHVISESGIVKRYRGDRISLGYRRQTGVCKITAATIAIGANSFVLSTDGIRTQIGARTKRVMGSRRFIEALEAVGENDPAKLTKALAKSLKDWQGGEERRDDVSLLAFKPLIRAADA